MATVSSSDALAVAEWDHGSESKSDRYLAARLAAAGADFKSVAVATFALGAAVAAATWLALGVLAEHWLVPGGLPVAARWAWLAAGVAALAAAVVRWAVPLVRYRVNLVYAARAIEHEHPELHNDIVNAVLVKARAEDATPLVVRSLERRAAKRLSVVPGDGIADRDVPLRLAVALASLVAALGVYQLVAPKSLVVSAARLVAPWWGLAAPARVSIAPPRFAWRMPPDGAGGDRPARPLEASGDTVTLVRGRQLVVETEIEGLRAGERAMLVVTPVRADGRDDGSAPWQIPLSAGTQPGRLTAVLPDAVRGLERSVDLLVAAGDARTERLRVAVVDTPTLLVREVHYDYPAYTGLRPETVAWQGDLRAPEFTKVTVTAECNRPLETAWIDPGCGGRDSERKRMRIGQHDLARASGEFPLRMNVDRTGPEFASYRLGFQSRSSPGGGEPPIVEKLEHRVEVIADVAPDVSIESPEDAIRVPPSAPVAIRVRALDPDYGLARVGIEARVRGAAGLPPAWMLDRTHQGPFLASMELVPERLGAAAGDVLEYRAIAIDTRPEKPNVSHSPWRSLQIDAAAPPPLDRQAPSDAGNKGNGMQPGRGDRGDEPQGGKGTAGENRPDRRPDEAAAGQKDQPQRRDDGGRQESGEQPEQTGRQGGESNAGAKGGGAGSQPKPEQSGSDAGGKPQSGGTSDRGGDGGQGKADGKKPGGRQEGSGDQGRSEQGRTDQGRSEATGSGQGGRDKSGQQAGAGGSQGNRESRGGEQAEGRGAGRSPPRNAVAADGTNDGEAMERILENRRRQETVEKGTQPEGGKKAGGQQSGTDGAKQRTDSGEKPRDGGTPKEGDSKQQQQSQCQGADGKPCGKEGCSKCNGGGSGAGSGQGQSGQGQSGQGQSGQGQSGQSQSGQGQSGQGQSGQGQSGQGQAGQGQAGQGQSGQGQSGQGQSGQGQSGQGQSGQGQSGQGQSGQGQSGQGQSGQGQSGQGQSGGERGQQGSRPGGDLPEGQKPGPGSQVGAGGQGGGDRGGSPAAAGAAPPRRDVEWTEQDTAHARNAADLAVEHIRDSVNAGRTDVLDELGWTPEQARAFIDRWQAMRRLAGSADARDRGEFEHALRSLGLRPDGVRTTRDVPADPKGGQSEGRRSRPPAAYREQVEAYLRGAGGE